MTTDVEACTRLWLEQNAGRRAARENYDKDGEYTWGPPSPSYVQKSTQFANDIQQRCSRYTAWCEHHSLRRRYIFVLYDPITEQAVHSWETPEDGFPTDEFIATVMLVAK